MKVRNLAKKIVILLIGLVVVLALLKPPVSYARQNSIKTVRVGWFDSSYFYMDSFGRKSGLAYEYQREIATYAGWKYEYVEGSFGELLQMLRDGEIDLLSDVSYTEERAKDILYPMYPMGEESYYIYISTGNDQMSIDDVKSFDGKVFGVVRDSIQRDMLINWAKEQGITLEIVDVSNDEEEAMELLGNGTIDAYVSMNTLAGNEQMAPVFKLGSSEFYFAVSKKKPDLLRDLNDALGKIQNEDPYYNQKIYQKYILSVKTSAFLDDKELAWQQEHGAIRIGYREDYRPFCAKDEESGELTGALKKYTELATKSILNCNLSFEPVAYPNTEEAMKALENREVDCVFPVSLSPYDSEQKGLLVTEPLMKSEVYGILKSDRLKDITLDDNLTVAISIGDTSYETFVREYYPGWNMIVLDDFKDCYDVVAQDRADLTLVSSYRLSQTDKYRGKYNLSTLATGKYLDFSFVVSEEDIDLYSLMNRTINLVSNSSLEAALTRYTYGEEKITFYDYMMDNLPAVISVVSLTTIAILILIILNMRSDKKAVERQKLISATEYDKVTGLYNRGFFYEYADRIVKEHPDDKYDAIAINLDQFHTVNALNGWEFGDEVLKSIGDEIKGYLEEKGGIACRSTADRFSVYCKHTDSHQDLFDRIQNRLDELSKAVSIRLRMGVMPWQEGLTIVQQFDHARTACNMVRGGHHSRLKIFNDELKNKELRDQRLLNDMRRALEESEFMVYYQPKFDIQADPPKMCGAEALVRWKHKELGIISPGEFIPLFEENYRIGQLDRYVWREVAKQIAAWRNWYGVVIPVSVNLSRLDVFDADLEQELDEIIEANGIDRSCFDLEVTESAYTENADQVIEIVRRLREKGHHIEMDDFGTGYSSLSMLSHMPVDILKLDRSFIWNMEKDITDVQMPELILDIAKGLKVPVVAEGVEIKEQLDFLKSRGCEMVQGFYFSPPVTATEFEERYLSRENRNGKSD